MGILTSKKLTVKIAHIKNKPNPSILVGGFAQSFLQQEK